MAKDGKGASADAGTQTDGAREFDRRRREALIRLGKATAYAAPVTVAIISMRASAGS